MIPENLQKFGLTEGEAKVYLALLKIGRSPIGKILQQSSVSHSKIYDILERLAQKSLVSKVSINKRLYFEGKDPSRLKDYILSRKKKIAEEEKELENYLPSLHQLFLSAEPVRDVEILIGNNGIKTWLDSILNELTEKDTYYILGVPKKTNDSMEAYFLDWYKKRADKRVRCKIIYNPEVKSLASNRGKQPYTDVRILPSGSDSPSGLNIVKDYVTILIFGERPFCIVIKNKEIAKTYLNYFNLLWNISEPIKYA
jgi:sugar-specific transcriptional regulator TrmB